MNKVKYNIVLILMNIFVVPLSTFVGILLTSELIKIPDHIQAGMFFIFTIFTASIFISNVKSVYDKKGERILYSILSLVTLVAFFYQLSAAVFVNFL